MGTVWITWQQTVGGGDTTCRNSVSDPEFFSTRSVIIVFNKQELQMSLRMPSNTDLWCIVYGVCIILWIMKYLRGGPWGPSWWIWPRMNVLSQLYVVCMIVLIWISCWWIWPWLSTSYIWHCEAERSHYAWTHNSPQSVSKAKQHKESEELFQLAALSDLEANGFDPLLLTLEIGALGHSLPSSRRALMQSCNKGYLSLMPALWSQARHFHEVLTSVRDFFVVVVFFPSSSDVPRLTIIFTDCYEVCPCPSQALGTAIYRLCSRYLMT